MGYSLEVIKEGSGTVNVHVGAAVAVFECAEPQCLFENLQATSVVLGVMPEPPWEFRGWSVRDQPGVCPGTGNCAITMDRDVTVTATFEPGTGGGRPGGGPGVQIASVGFNLTVNVGGQGGGDVHVGTGLGSTLECQVAQCLYENVEALFVTVIPRPDAGSTFQGWSVPDQPGACPGTGPCDITMDRDVTVIATFARP